MKGIVRTVSEGLAAVSIEQGVLYVVATPIGNLQDISPRARQVLGSVDVVLRGRYPCERASIKPFWDRDAAATVSSA